MYAEVVPKYKLPLEADVFDYEIPKELEPVIKPGFLVYVSLRGKQVLGLVYKIKEHTEFKKVLPIIDTVLPFPPFTAKDIKILDFISNYYLVSKSTALNALMPEAPLRKATFKQIAPVEVDYRYENDAHELENFKTPVLYSYEDRSALLSNIKNHIDRLEAGGQVLILEPQILSVSITASFLNKFFNEQITVLHSGLSKTEYWRNWLDFAEGRKRIAVTTRAGIFLPGKNIKSIFINDEDFPDYKQYDQNPRYDARTIALKIQDLKDANLILTSKSPRLATWDIFTNNKWPVLNDANIKCDFSVIDLEDERRKYNFSLFSHSLEDGAEKALQKGKKVLLFFNRRGYATSVICRDCGYTAMCPDCQLPYVAHQNRLICHHCANEAPMVLKCPTCSSVNIKMIGAGTEKLEKEIKDLFGKYRILRLDRDVDLKNNIKLADYDIIFGTNLILKDYEWQLTKDLGVGTIGIINADNLFNIPDYRSTERAWQEIRKILNLSSSLGAKLYIQTRRPNNSVLTNLDKMNNFYGDELAARKKFNYPPFKKLVKLISQDKEQFIAAKRIEGVLNQLKPACDDRGIEIMGPYRSSPEKIRNQYRFLITLKIDQTENLDFLKQLPNGIMTDVDPEFILT